MDRSELDRGRWRRQPETQAFLEDLLEQFQEVRHWHRTSLQSLPTLQGKAQVIEWILDYAKHDDGR